MDDLYNDQKGIACVIMNAVREWVECEDLSKFEPLRMVVNGSGGAGKSVVINTIVTVMREMFDCNDVIRVAAPTGTSAFNVGGETLHHFTGMGTSEMQYKANSMTPDHRIRLIKKCKTLLALVIDERSMVSTKVLGTTSRMLAETMFEGGPLSHLSFGGLPIVVLFGDDFQLPSQEESALDALFSKGGGKMNVIGRGELLSCANFVMELCGNKRLQDDREDDKKLLGKVRTNSKLEDKDVDRLLNLHLSRMEEQHGVDEVTRIEQKSIHLFYRNEPKTRKNIESIRNVAEEKENPVAIVRPICYSAPTGKGNSSHFGNSKKPPEASIICRGAKVALEGRNFNPLWGLHNGACGVVEEIVFAEDSNPNQGNLPMYVVVNFPLYCGPVWDVNNPKVRNAQLILYLSHIKSQVISQSCMRTAVVRTHSTSGPIVPKELLQQNVSTAHISLRKDNPQIPGTLCWSSGHWKNSQYVRVHCMRPRQW